MSLYDLIFKFIYMIGFDEKDDVYFNKTIETTDEIRINVRVGGWDEFYLIISKDLIKGEVTKDMFKNIKLSYHEGTGVKILNKKQGIIDLIEFEFDSYKTYFENILKNKNNILEIDCLKDELNVYFVVDDFEMFFLFGNIIKIESMLKLIKSHYEIKFDATKRIKEKNIEFFI